MRRILRKSANIGFISLLLITQLLCVGCGLKDSRETVRITFWIDEENVSALRDRLDKYRELNEDKANYEFVVCAAESSNSAYVVLGDPENAADVFVFYDTLFGLLYDQGALLDISEGTQTVVDSIGGSDSSVAQVGVVDGKMYAFPVSVGNGLILFYDSQYYTAEDVTNMDCILEVANQNGKKVAADFSNGFFIYPFFKGAGLEVYAGQSESDTVCNWNDTESEIKGVDVATSMLNIARNPAFQSCTEKFMLQGMDNGQIIAGITGVNNSQQIKKIWGENYQAAKLPTYTIRDEQIQLYSLSVCELLGVNAKTKYPDEIKDILAYMSNSEIQLEFSGNNGANSSNTEANMAEEIQNSIALNAWNEQAKFSTENVLPPTYWDPAKLLGIHIAGNNADHMNMQRLLDETVRNIKGGRL